MDTKFFQIALELEKQFRDQLIENEVKFRASLNSLSLISLSKERPELGVTCKDHQCWTSEVLDAYIEKIKSKPIPGRPTPEKLLQAWIIKSAQENNHQLPFGSAIRFITSELAIHNKKESKIVSDIIGYDTKTKQLVIVELKSDRHLKRLIEQVDNFEEIISDNFLFFRNLLALHGFSKLEKESKKVIVWPHERTSPLEKLQKLNIAEYTYQKVGENYHFIDHN